MPRISIGDVRANPRGRVNCIIKPGILPRKGLIVLFGDPELGKSWLLQQIGLGIAGGDIILGFFPTERTRVVGFDIEMGEYPVSARLSQVAPLFPEIGRAHV